MLSVPILFRDRMTCILHEHQGKENVWCQNISSLSAALLDTLFLISPHLKPVYSS